MSSSLFNDIITNNKRDARLVESAEQMLPNYYPFYGLNKNDYNKNLNISGFTVNGGEINSYEKMDLDYEKENNSLNETGLNTIIIEPREMKEKDYLRLEKEFSGYHLSDKTNQIFADIYKYLHEIIDESDKINSEYLPPKEENKLYTEKVTEQSEDLCKPIEIPQKCRLSIEENIHQTEKIPQKYKNLYKVNEISFKYIFPAKEEKKSYPQEKVQRSQSKDKPNEEIDTKFIIPSKKNMNYYTEETPKTFKPINNFDNINKTPFNNPENNDFSTIRINQVNESSWSILAIIDDLLPDDSNSIENEDLFDENTEERQYKRNLKGHPLSAASAHVHIKYLNKNNVSKSMKEEAKDDNMPGITIIEDDDYSKFEQIKGTNRKTVKSRKYGIFRENLECNPRFLLSEPKIEPKYAQFRLLGRKRKCYVNI